MKLAVPTKWLLSHHKIAMQSGHVSLVAVPKEQGGPVVLVEERGSGVKCGRGTDGVYWKVNRVGL